MERPLQTHATPIMCQFAPDCRRLAGEDHRSTACSNTAQGVCFASDTGRPPEVPRNMRRSDRRIFEPLRGEFDLPIVRLRQDDHTKATIADSPVRLSTKAEPILCIDGETYSP